MWCGDLRPIALIVLLAVSSVSASAEPVEDLIEKGKKFQLDGDDLKAIECFSNALRLAPNNDKIYRLKGASELPYTLNWNDRCIADYTHAIQINPQDYESLCWRAFCMTGSSKQAAMSDLTRAQEILKKLPESADVVKYRAVACYLKDPKSGYNELKLWRDKYPQDKLEANFYLCCNAFQRGDKRNAQEFGDLALQALFKEARIHPSSSNFRMIARTGIQSGRHKEALEWFGNFLKDNPNSSHAHYWRSYMRLAERRSPPSVAELELAVRLQPQYLYRVNHLADLLVAEKRHAEAAQAYAQILAAYPDNSQVRIKRVTCLRAMRMERVAIKELTSALIRKPNDYKLLLTLSELEQQFNPGSSRLHLQEALAAADMLIKERPRDPDLYIDRAEIHKSQRHYDKALADFDQAINVDPNNALLYIYRAGFYWNSTNQKERALEDVTKAISIPNSQHNTSAYHLTRSSYALSLNQLQLAMLDANEAIRLEPESCYGYRIRALVHLGLKQFDAALAAIDKASRLRGDCDDLDYLRGRALEGMHKTKEAITAYSTNHSKYPKNVNCLMCRGDLFLRQENYRSAINDFTKVLEIEPKSADAYIVRGRANSYVGDYSKAISDISQGMILKNADREAWLLEDRARYYTYAARYREAAHDMDNAFRDQPSSPHRLFISGKLFYRAGDKEAAIKRISEYITLVPDDRKALRARARCYFETDQIAKSIPDYTEIIRQFPSPEIYTLRARSYAMLGNRELEHADLAMAKKLSVSD
ncbi:MAG: tetratricopeptide repeat protein [Candidatus Obscuribacterales bacterium]|nr:tetratricopeptide repeat protein [Candidatus Obscuribacterales bacterium]